MGRKNKEKDAAAGANDREKCPPTAGECVNTSVFKFSPSNHL